MAGSFAVSAVLAPAPAGDSLFSPLRGAGQIVSIIPHPAPGCKRGAFRRAASRPSRAARPLPPHPFFPLRGNPHPLPRIPPRTGRTRSAGKKRPPLRGKFSRAAATRFLRPSPSFPSKKGRETPGLFKSYPFSAALCRARLPAPRRVLPLRSPARGAASSPAGRTSPAPQRGSAGSRSSGRRS